jgi:Asp-tRNA(Asn)/Glu-tRNA(Gln) amidotransferase B subunit
LIKKHDKAVSDYKAGKKAALGPIIGILKKKLNLDPADINAFLEKRLL